LPIRFIQIKAAPVCIQPPGRLVVALLRLVYESCCIPGPARPEAEQAADEFVYEME
jgi:hypothetical protein